MRQNLWQLPSTLRRIAFDRLDLRPVNEHEFVCFLQWNHHVREVHAGYTTYYNRCPMDSYGPHFQRFPQPAWPPLLTLTLRSHEDVSLRLLSLSHTTLTHLQLQTEGDLSAFSRTGSFPVLETLFVHANFEKGTGWEWRGLVRHHLPALKHLTLRGEHSGMRLFLEESRFASFRSLWDPSVAEQQAKDHIVSLCETVDVEGGPYYASWLDCYRLRAFTLTALRSLRIVNLPMALVALTDLWQRLATSSHLETLTLDVRIVGRESTSYGSSPLEDAQKNEEDKRALLRVLTTTVTIHPALRSLSLALSDRMMRSSVTMAMPGHEVLRVFAQRFPQLVTLTLTSFPLQGLGAAEGQRLRDALPSLRYLQLPSPAGTVR